MTTEAAPSLSDRLIQAREARGETVEQVNQLIGISPNVLLGLENGHLDVVEPVYVLLALKSYAEHLELDVDEMLRMLEAELHVATKPTPIAVAASAGDGASLMSDGAARVDDALEMIRQLPQAQRLAIVAAVVLIAVFVAFWFTGNLGDSTAQSNRQPQETTVAERQPDGAADAVDEVSSVPNAVAASVSPDPTEDSSSTPPPAQQPDRGSSEEAAVTAPETETQDVQVVAGTQTDSAGQGEIVDLEITREPPAASVVPAPSAVAAPVDSSTALAPPREERPAILEPVTTVPQDASGLLTLEAEAVDSTWVQIQWDGGAGGTEVVIPQGQRRRWQAREFFMVKAGRAHGVRFYLEGKLLGNGRLGDPTEVLRFRASKDSVTLLSRDLRPLSQLSVERDITASD
jgi:cytoskeletal protein RodZ